MHARRTSRAATPPTIEGEAQVIGRRPGAPLPRREAEPAAPTNDNRPDAPTPPGRRSAPADLVFPRLPRWPAAGPHGFAMPAGRRRTLALAAGCLAAAVAVAASLLFGGASRPSPARPAAALPFPAAFALADTKVSLAPRGSGAVLTVEGRIRNLSGERRDVPELRVRVAGEPGFSHAFRPGRAPLGPGRSLFFHSTLAVPSATTADGIGVFLAGADWRRS